MERKSRFFKQPKMKQKEYLAMVIEKQHTAKSSTNFQDDSNQTRMTQRDLLESIDRQRNGITSRAESYHSQASSRSIPNYRDHSSRNSNVYSDMNFQPNDMIVSHTQPPRKPPRSILKRPTHSFYQDTLNRERTLPENYYDENNDGDFIFEDEDSYEEYLSPRAAAYTYDDRSRYTMEQQQQRSYSARTPELLQYENERLSMNSQQAMLDNRNYRTPKETKYVEFPSHHHPSSQRQNMHAPPGKLQVINTRHQLQGERVVDLGTFITSKMSGLKLRKHGRLSDNHVHTNGNLINKVQLRDVRHVSSPKVLRAQNGEVLLVNDNGVNNYTTQELLY